ncbi:hypothetical protein GCM10009716_31510 [Streptomyces sodiiphilus]|uniref:non-specific serine/threonine protein kinase n=1 Tax=Streptomyces sodiiphilus TaxID=226217 RepID=A0ABN2PFV2_9ACTN
MGQDNGDSRARAAEPAEHEDKPSRDTDTPREVRDDDAPTVAAKLLNGRYRLGGVVGRGGMGTVWRARDEILGREVAVKELRVPAGIDDGELRRLTTRTLREAKAMSAIRSRGVVTVYDVVDEDSRPWIVMELINGRSLADIIREDGPMTPRQAARTGLSVLEVLGAAHRQGILHRDVKPSNVIVADEDGRVVLTDFGIAKVEGDPSITSTGMLVGAPSYISPERAHGETLGPAADMWSLGALLYCAVEGRPPFDAGGAIATLTAVMNDPVPTPRNAGPLAEVITGLLAKEPDDRLDEAGARKLLKAASAPVAEPSTAGAAAAATAGKAGEAGKAAETEKAGGPGDARTLKEDSGRRTTALAAASPGPEDAGQAKPAPAGRAASGGTPLAAGRRRLLVAGVVAVVLLALLGAALASTMGGGKDEEASGGAGSGQRDDDAAGGDPDGPGGSGGTDGGADASDGGADAGEGTEDGGEPGADDEYGEDGGERDPAGSGDGDGGPGGEGGASPQIPEGYAEITDTDFRFRVALPEGWERVRIAGQNSGGEYSDPAGGPPMVQIDFTSSPGNDAAAAWRLLEPATQSASRNYRRIGIEEIEWRGYPTVADWEFERVVRGRDVRVLNRGFRVDAARGYAIMITCVADEWDGKECRTLRDTAFSTFQPLE